MIMLLIIDMSINLAAQERKISSKNSLINKFCIATLKSKLNIKNKKNINEISDFTCECFLKKYKSGSSIKISRLYCKNLAAEKYNL